MIGLGCGLVVALTLALEDESTASAVRRTRAEAGITVVPAASDVGRTAA